MTPACRWIGAFAVATLVWGHAPVSAQDTIRMWRDERGVVHFSNSGAPKESETLQLDTSPNIRPIPLESDPMVPSRKYVMVEFEGTMETVQVRMLVDTGADMTLIDSSTANRIGVHFLREQMMMGVGGVAAGKLVEVPKLRIGSAELKDVSVVVTPNRGLTLLGADVLNQLNLSVGQSTLYRSSK